MQTSDFNLDFFFSLWRKLSCPLLWQLFTTAVASVFATSGELFTDRPSFSHPLAPSRSYRTKHIVNKWPIRFGTFPWVRCVLTWVYFLKKKKKKLTDLKVDFCWLLMYHLNSLNTDAPLVVLCHEMTTVSVWWWSCRSVFFIVLQQLVLKPSVATGGVQLRRPQPAGRAPCREQSRELHRRRSFPWTLQPADAVSLFGSQLFWFKNPI